MTIPDASQLAKIRTHPQNTKMYLSVYQPQTVFAARVNDPTAARGERIISYDTVTAGSPSLVQGGMTMLVGNSAGASDKGTVRVRSSTGSVLTVAENYDIAWGDDDYITILNFYEINPMLPRVYSDPVTPDNTTWYKDYDIAYTNQNSVLGSFVCMGSHYAGFKNDQVYYTAEGTTNLKGESLSYFWFFEGATVTGSTSQIPGYITYNTPGHYTTRLIVSGTASADVSYRHISIYDRPNEGSNVPILNWELTDMTGDRDQGGYTAKIKIHQSVPKSLIRAGSLIVLFSDDWYGDLTTRYQYGGNATNRSSIFFVGYVLGSTIRYNYRESSVEFEVGSPTEIMKLADGFGITVEDSTDPDNATTNDPDAISNWNYVLHMTVRRALYHYLRWHTTALMCNDFQFNGTDRDTRFYSSDVGSIFDAVNSFMTGAYLGKMCCDRQGKIWLEKDIFIENDFFATNLSFAITKQDWIGEPEIEEVLINSVCYLEAGGEAYDGDVSPTTYTPLLSNAPGQNFTTRGKNERIQGLILTDQDDLNTATGNLYAQKNTPYPSVELKMAGMYKCYDIAPQEVILINMEASDTIRGISFVGMNFTQQSLQYEWKPETETLLVSLNVFNVPSVRWPGTTVSIPVAPVEDDNQINVPPIRFPSLPVINISSGGGALNFIPVTTGWTSIDGGASTRLYPDGYSDDGYDVATIGGIIMNSYMNRGVTSVDTTAFGTFRTASAGTFTFTPLFESFGGGTLSGIIGNTTATAWYGPSDKSAVVDSIVDTDAGTVTTDGQGYIFPYTSGAITISLSAGSVVGMKFRRRSSAALGDTYEGCLNLIGWKVT